MLNSLVIDAINLGTLQLTESCKNSSVPLDMSVWMTDDLFKVNVTLLCVQKP